jgi:putative heme iron utilization protein
MQTKHAPAPWKSEFSVALQAFYVVASDAKNIAALSGTRSTQEANASLIAAAPEMAALLDKIKTETNKPGANISRETWYEIVELQKKAGV